MFFFFHLLTGLVIGLLIADLLRDRRWIIPCAIGAVLPDLIDKTLGHIIFADSIGYGRIYAHTLLCFAVIFLTGLIVWKYRKSPVIVGMAVGIVSHQVLDLMWNEPANWFFPFQGPFQGHLPTDYVFTLITAELNNPPEVLVALILGLGALVYLKFRHKIMQTDDYRAFLKSGLLVCALIFFVIGGIILGKAMTGETLSFTGWSQVDESTLGGIVMILTAYAAWRLLRRIDDIALQ